VTPFQDARALIARLGMRPHANAELIKQAKDAADAMREAIQLAAKALLNHRIERPAEEAEAAGAVPAAVRRGFMTGREPTRRSLARR
jgi:hypothetical protein